MTNSDYYFIPLCNKDFTFENIFSTESISPLSFYTQRNFGISHFYPITDYSNQNILLLYNAVPQFKVNASGSIKFVLAITRNEIESNDMIFIADGIVGVQKTIYLTSDNFKVVFFSEKDMKIVIAKSEISLPTKPVKKYVNNFVLAEEADSIEFNPPPLDFLKKLSNITNHEILFDERFNTLKGYIYGLITEIIFEKTPEEIKIKRDIQMLINSHAEFKNRIELSNRQTEARYTRSGNQPLSLFFNKVLDKLKELEFQVTAIFPKKNIEYTEVADLIFKQVPHFFSSKEEAVHYIRIKHLDSLLLGTDDYTKLKKKAFAETQKTDLSFIIETIYENLTAKFSSSGVYLASRGATRYDDDRFKESIYKLENLINQYYTANRKNRPINLKSIKYVSQSDEIELTSDFGYSISEIDKKEYNSLANIILKNAKNEKGEATKIKLLEIVKKGAQTHNKSVISTDTLLYKYLNNEIDVYSLEKVTSGVMKNFVAFIFNPDSIEKLEKYLDINAINNKWMAYSFWCGFNGFASIGSNFLKPMFTTDGADIHVELDNFFAELRDMISKKQNYLEKPTQTLQAEKSNTEIQIRLDYFNKFIKDKFKFTFEELSAVLELKKENEKLKSLKTKYNIESKDAKHILNSYTKFIKSPHLF